MFLCVFWGKKKLFLDNFQLNIFVCLTFHRDFVRIGCCTWYATWTQFNKIATLILSKIKRNQKNLEKSIGLQEPKRVQEPNYAMGKVLGVSYYPQK